METLERPPTVVVDIATVKYIDHEKVFYFMYGSAMALHLEWLCLG